MIEDRPINDDEEEILDILKQYSSGNPYTRITYDQIKPEHWKAFSEEIVVGVIREYLQMEKVDYVRLRWFFRRLAQVGHAGALSFTIDNIDSLEPCLPNICAYLASVQEVPPEDWREIGEKLLSLLEDDIVKDSEFAKLSMLSLFSKNQDIDHFAKLGQLFAGSDNYTQREILLAARVNSEVDWLREHKDNYSSMDPWQRMAYVYCVSEFPRDERAFFLKGLIKNETSPFEKRLMKWARDA